MYVQPMSGRPVVSLHFTTNDTTRHDALGSFLLFSHHYTTSTLMPNPTLIQYPRTPIPPAHLRLRSEKPNDPKRRHLLSLLAQQLTLHEMRAARDVMVYHLQTVFVPPNDPQKKITQPVSQSVFHPNRFQKAVARRKREVGGRRRKEEERRKKELGGRRRKKEEGGRRRKKGGRREG